VKFLFKELKTSKARRAGCSATFGNLQRTSSDSNQINAKVTILLLITYNQLQGRRSVSPRDCSGYRTLIALVTAVPERRKALRTILTLSSSYALRLGPNSAPLSLP
jgi:hypothetical protein